jgi:hypothetical protein
MLLHRRRTNQKEYNIIYVQKDIEMNEQRQSCLNNMATTEKENNRIFQPKCLINGFVTILTRWVPLVEQELLIPPEICISYK